MFIKYVKPHVVIYRLYSFTIVRCVVARLQCSTEANNSDFACLASFTSELKPQRALITISI